MTRFGFPPSQKKEKRTRRNKYPKHVTVSVGLGLFFGVSYQNMQAIVLLAWTINGRQIQNGKIQTGMPHTSRFGSAAWGDSFAMIHEKVKQRNQEAHGKEIHVSIMCLDGFVVKSAPPCEHKRVADCNIRELVRGRDGVSHLEVPLEGHLEVPLRGRLDKFLPNPSNRWQKKITNMVSHPGFANNNTQLTITMVNSLGLRRPFLAVERVGSVMYKYKIMLHLLFPFYLFPSSYSSSSSFPFFFVSFHFLLC